MNEQIRRHETDTVTFFLINPSWPAENTWWSFSVTPTGKKKKKGHLTRHCHLFCYGKSSCSFFLSVRHLKPSPVMQGNNLTVYQCKSEEFYMMVHIFGMKGKYLWTCYLNGKWLLSMIAMCKQCLRQDSRKIWQHSPLHDSDPLVIFSHT